MGRQFVVQLENHPGELAHLARALASRGIDINHITCVGTGPLACVFLTTSNDEATRAVLRGMGNEFIEGRPIVVRVEDRPGGFADVTEKLAAAGVNINGVLPVNRGLGFVEMTFCVDDEAKAREALGMTPLELVGAAN